MAKAFRTDKTESERWANAIAAVRSRKDAEYLETCAECGVSYSVFFGILEDIDPCIELLRGSLKRECPDHAPEFYSINEAHSGRIIGEP